MTAARSSALDGVRGLAALSVVFLHVASLFLLTKNPDYFWFDRFYRWVSVTPAAALWAGQQAVSLFFILSGYALYSMLSGRAMSYASYAARRILRLWIPYAVVIALAAICVIAFGSGTIAGQSGWLNSFLGTQVSVKLLAQHALMIGFYDTKRLDFVIWSLVIEMRLSLVFPLLFYAIKRFNGLVLLVASVGVGAAGILLLRHHEGTVQGSIGLTLSSNTYFVIGGLLAHHASLVRDRYAGLSALTKAIALIAAFVLYANCLGVSSTYSTMIGSTWLIIVALCSPSAQAFLDSRVVQFLGHISYSLYLVHAVVVLALINALYPSVSMGTVAVLVVPLSIAVASVLYACVERPLDRLEPPGRSQIVRSI